MINKFTCSNRIASILYNLTWCVFPSCFWYPRQLPHFVTVSVPLSPMMALVSTSCRFVVFYSFVRIFDVDPDSIINLSLSYLFLDYFFINSSSYITSSVIFEASSLDFFLL